MTTQHKLITKSTFLKYTTTKQIEVLQKEVEQMDLKDLKKGLEEIKAEPQYNNKGGIFDFFKMRSEQHRMMS